MCNAVAAVQLLCCSCAATCCNLPQHVAGAAVLQVTTGDLLCVLQQLRLAAACSSCSWLVAVTAMMVAYMMCVCVLLLGLLQLAPACFCVATMMQHAVAATLLHLTQHLTCCVC